MKKRNRIKFSIASAKSNGQVIRRDTNNRLNYLMRELNIKPKEYTFNIQLRMLEKSFI